MFCICCLEGNGPYINLITCDHAEYFERFNIPDVKPLDQLICCRCHSTLMKIKDFNLKTEQSFNLLMTQSDSIKICNNDRISKIIPCNTTQTENNDKITKMKNIETALEIIKNNSTSFKTLAVCDLKTITDTLLKATTDSLNLDLSVAMLPEQCKEVGSVDMGLPVNKVGEIDPGHMTVYTHRPKRKEPFKGHNNKPEDNSRRINDERMMTVKDNEFGSAIEIFSDITLPCANVAETKNKTTNELINDISNSVLRNEIKNTSNVEGVSNSVYDTPVLPDTKHDPVEQSAQYLSYLNNFSKNNSESNEASTSCTNDDASTEQRSDYLPLIPIVLNTVELLAERATKMNSMEFLKWPYRCDDCVIGFEYKMNYDDHKKRKHEMKNGCSKCDICKQVIPNPDMSKHVFRHYSRLECEACKQRFMVYDEAYVHYEEVHKTNGKDPVKRLVNICQRHAKKPRYKPNNPVTDNNPSGSQRQNRPTSLQLRLEFARTHKKCT